jgi:hypothetical protein
MHPPRAPAQAELLEAEECAVGGPSRGPVDARLPEERRGRGGGGWSACERDVEVAVAEVAVAEVVVAEVAGEGRERGEAAAGEQREVGRRGAGDRLRLDLQLDLRR